MDGAAITITIMSLAAAHTLGIPVDLPTGIILSILATLSACGASGVAGGSLLLIPMACSLFGIPNDIAMQVVGVGFIIGVIQDSVETALNSSSDLLLSASAEFRQWRLNGREMIIEIPGVFVSIHLRAMHIFLSERLFTAPRFMPDYIRSDTYSCYGSVHTLPAY